MNRLGNSNSFGIAFFITLRNGRITKGNVLLQHINKLLLDTYRIVKNFLLMYNKKYNIQTIKLGIEL